MLAADKARNWRPERRTTNAFDVGPWLRIEWRQESAGRADALAISVFDGQRGFARRVAAPGCELRDEGTRVGRKRAGLGARLMRKVGLRGVGRRCSFIATTRFRTRRVSPIDFERTHLDDGFSEPLRRPSQHPCRLKPSVHPSAKPGQLHDHDSIIVGQRINGKISAITTLSSEALIRI
jgi:hypothetical protein